MLVNQAIELMELILQNEKFIKYGKIQYLNTPISFDIETTSFKDNEGEKVAIMYLWSFAIRDKVIFGRTWDEFKKLLQSINRILNLDEKRQIIIYVHNLSFEFQFMRKHFEWDKVFSINLRKPIYAITNTGICFKCSYLLSSYSLAKLAENIPNNKIKKLVGNLDYSLVHTPITEITKDEYDYSANDVLIVTAFIENEIEKNGNIAKIPLTSTGYVRKFCREKIFTKDSRTNKRNQYYRLMQSLTISSKEEYSTLKHAFLGGFTHGNNLWINTKLSNVASYDFTSSYPAVMCSELYPMSQGQKVYPKTVDELEELTHYYCVVMKICLYDVESKINFEHYLSYSRVLYEEKALQENGRIYKADKIVLCITNVDYEIVKQTYNYSHIEIGGCYVYKKAYLPKKFILSIADLYQSKNLLKYVKGKEEEYMKSKQMLNSTYGMSVTNIIRDDILYNEGWETNKKTDREIENELADYNNKNNRFLFYPWGIFITAYARRNLWSAILELKNDYIYSDTDSVKVLNHNKHSLYFKKYNIDIRRKIKTMCDFYGIDFDLFQPKGKMIGVWDFEGVYDSFKTLGSKRYITTVKGKTTITVAGLNKKTATPYLLKKYGDKIYENFKDGLYIPAEYTGKMTHTYIDDVKEGVIKDYKGQYYKYRELGGIHLENANYTLDMSVEFLKFLQCFNVNYISYG